MASNRVFQVMSNVSFAGFLGRGELDGRILFRVDDSAVAAWIDLVMQDEKEDTFDVTSPARIANLLQSSLLIGVEGNIVKTVKELLPLLKQYVQFEEFEL